MNIRPFGKWNEAELTGTEQIKRMGAAQKIKAKNVTIKSDDVYLIQGSGTTPYTVTLNSCTCMDYAMNKKPCKHIFYMALKMGYISFPSYNQEAAKLFDFKSEKEKYEKMFNDGIISADSYLKIISALDYEEAESTKCHTDKSECEQLVLLPETEKQEGKQNYESDQNSSSVLGCCSKYRECSQAGKCIQTDEYYKQCAYRKNLENGQIFYSKKSIFFNQERYDYLAEYYRNLDDEKRDAFNELLDYFFSKKRGVEDCLCIYSKQIYSIVSDCVAFNLHTGTELASKLFGSEIILVKSASKFYSQHSLTITPAEIDNNAQNKNDKLQIWRNAYLQSESVQSALSERFIYFSVSEYAPELEELFFENMAEFKFETRLLVAFTSDTLNDFKHQLFT